MAHLIMKTLIEMIKRAAEDADVIAIPRREIGGRWYTDVVDNKVY